MKELSREKRLDVALCLLLGYSYQEIEEETGVSHGSIANIVKELENGIFTVPGTPFDQVNDLRELASDLKKKGLQPSQAILGLTFFDRLQSLEISPEHLDAWSEMVKMLIPADFPASDYLEAALRLHELEMTHGESFETIAEQYVSLREESETLRQEVDSLSTAKSELSDEIEPLSSQIEVLNKEKDKLESHVEIETARLKELKQRVKESEQEKSGFEKETAELKRTKLKLSSNLQGKEEALHKLNEIGLSDEDLLRVRAFLDRTGKSEGISPDKVRDDLFTALSLFKDISGLEREREAEVGKVKELAKNKSILTGEILELEKRKGILEGEIGKNVSVTLQGIRDIGAEATNLIQQHVDDIKGQLYGLLEDMLKTGEAVGEMRQLVSNGEESQHSLEEFMKDVETRLGRS